MYWPDDFQILVGSHQRKKGKTDRVHPVSVILSTMRCNDNHSSRPRRDLIQRRIVIHRPGVNRVQCVHNRVSRYKHLLSGDAHGEQVSPRSLRGCEVQVRQDSR